MISPMSPLGNCKVNKEDNNHNIDNKIIEIQSSSEKGLHNIQQLNLMYENGLNAINHLFSLQKKIIERLA